MWLAIGPGFVDIGRFVFYFKAKKQKAGDV